MGNREKLQKQIDELIKLPKERRRGSEFNARHSKTLILIEDIYGKDSRMLKEFEKIKYSSMADKLDYAVFLKGVSTAGLLIKSMLDDADELEKRYSNNIIQDVDLVLENIFNKFHIVTKQLRARHDDRPTLDISDEYDVQDLLHGLLRQYFEDIRPEERNPSYAGSSKRTDFLLKNEQIMIEVKKTRSNLKNKEIGEQLIIDIANYKGHQDCKKLFCFVYDPDGYIKNPRGLENDLGKNGEISVKVYIRPE